jgi:hypothetical protein
MSDPAITVRDVFELPKPGGPEEGSEAWQAFRDRIGTEFKSLKTAAMPDLAAKVGELLDVPLPGIFLTSWKKTNVLNELLAESQKTPEVILNLELAEHTINSQHRPHIEVQVQNRTPKKIEFILRLVFKLKGFVLKIQNGAITEMLPGTCDVRGTLEYQGLTIAEKKLAPVTLPGSIPLQAVRTFWKQDNYLKTPEDTVQSKSIEAANQLRAALALDQQKGVEVIDRLRNPEPLDAPMKDERVEATAQSKSVEAPNQLRAAMALDQPKAVEVIDRLRNPEPLDAPMKDEQVEETAQSKSVEAPNQLRAAVALDQPKAVEVLDRLRNLEPLDAPIKDEGVEEVLKPREEEETEREQLVL